MSTYTPIASVTLASAQSSVTFSGIPQTYTDLRLIINASVTSSADNVCFRYNSDSGSNYSRTGVGGNGTSALSARSSNATFYEIDYYGYLETTPSLMYSDIMNYSNSTTNKTAISRSANSANGTGATVGLWRNTAAITSITIFTKGSINFASGSTFNLYGVANASITNVAQATGGNSVVTDGNYWYHTFTSSGTFAPTSSISADILLVAGGGGSNQGGGGAGGVLGFTSQSLTAQNYTVTVGAGGAAGSGNGTVAGGNGSNSVFGSLTAAVGGGGGAGPASGNGGSGGGGPQQGGGPTIVGGTGTSGQGNAGGNNAGFFGDPYPAGGGGGAGAAGGNATSNTAAGIGGVGTSAYSAWGAATNTGQLSGGTYYYAGGGGGGVNNSTAYSAAGGLGGGGIGRGGQAGGGSAGDAGTANTGGGAGGQGTGGRTGGSGIVIVRYAV